jgi:hypothetical protein
MAHNTRFHRTAGFVRSVKRYSVMRVLGPESQ